MKNLIPLYLVLGFTMPLCWGMNRGNSDEYRRWVLRKSAQKDLQSYQIMQYKIRTIIANRYTGMEDLTEEEQKYLLKEYVLRDGETQDLSFTKQVFFERFIAWSSLKNISKNLVSESENIPSISPASVLIDQILASIESASQINSQNNCTQSVPQVNELHGNNPTLPIHKKNALEPLSRNSTEPRFLLFPTEEFPLILDEDEGSGYFFPERLS